MRRDHITSDSSPRRRTPSSSRRARRDDDGVLRRGEESDVMWSLRITLAKLRPINGKSITRTAIVVAVFAAFLYGDFALFRRLFLATSKLQTMTPLLALGLLRNLLALVFLVATVVLFSSAMTTAIGSFFTDLDLDTYHAAPRSRTRIAIARWGKTLVQSATIVFSFLIPMIVAFARQYGAKPSFYPLVIANLALLLSIPVSLASIVIVLLVRWFPVRRVHQIVATIAILVLTVAVIAFRMSRPNPSSRKSPPTTRFRGLG